MMGSVTELDREVVNRARILVIDDDEVMREILPAMLGLGADMIEVTGSGQEAIERLKRSAAPAVILTDLQMPELEGSALVAALRDAAPRSTLIGMSANAPADDVLEQLDAFILKPFSAADLEQAITAIAQQNQPAPAVSTTVVQHSGSAAVQPVLDDEIFRKMAARCKPEDLVQIYELTVADVLQRHKRLEVYAAAGDLNALQREAHAIKGVCGMMGARELQHLAAETEAGTMVNTLAIAEFPAACSRLRRMLDAKFHTQI